MSSVALVLALSPAASVVGASATAAGRSQDAAGDAAGFGWIAERLDRGLVAIGRLAAMLEALPRDAGSREIAEAEASLRALGAGAAALAGGIAAKRNAVAALAGILKAAALPLDDLARGIRTVGIVAVNARVVAAGVLRAGEGLELFTSDVAEMSAEAVSVLERIAAAQRRLTEDLRRLDRQWSQFEAAQRGPLAEVPGCIEAPLEAAAGERREAAKTGARLGERARAIAARLAGAAPVLRVGEATRTRMTRVQALPGLFDAFFRQHEAHIDADLHGALLDAVRRLQAAQIGSALDAFTRETAEASDRLRGVAGEVDALEQQARLPANGTPGGKIRSAHAALEVALAAAGAVLTDCAAEIRGLDGAGAEACAAAAGLLADVKAVGAIQENLRLLSLNASVKCAQLGTQGRVLNVIAQQLRELSGEITAAAESATVALAGAAMPLATLGAASEDAADALYTADPVAMEALKGPDRRFAAALAILAEAGPRVSVMLEEAAEAVGTRPAVTQALTAARSRILALCAADPPVFAGSGRQGAEALFAAIHRLYPTEAERAAHDELAVQLLAPTEARQPAIIPAPAPAHP